MISVLTAKRICDDIDLPFGYTVQSVDPVHYAKRTVVDGVSQFCQDPKMRVIIQLPSMPDTYNPGTDMERFTMMKAIAAETEEEFLFGFTTLMMMAVCHEVFEKCSKAGTQLMDPHPKYTDSTIVADGGQVGAYWDLQEELLLEFVEGIAAISPPHKPMCTLCRSTYVTNEEDRLCKFCDESTKPPDVIRVPLEVLEDEVSLSDDELLKLATGFHRTSDHSALVCSCGEEFADNTAKAKHMRAVIDARKAKPEWVDHKPDPSTLPSGPAL